MFIIKIIKTHLVSRNCRAFLTALFVTGLLLEAYTPFVHAKSVTQAEFLSVAIFRLSEHITWPDSAKISQYRIHIIDEGVSLEEGLKRIAAVRKLHSRPMVISRSVSDKLPEDVNVVFISKSRKSYFKSILRQIKNLPILLISYDIGDKRNVMIDFQSDKQSKIKFNINKANLINRNLLVDPNIILLGGSEIDIARLYKKVQLSLAKEEEQIRAVKKEIAKAKQAKDLLEQILTDLKETVEQQRSSYSKLENETQFQAVKIKKQIAELNNRTKRLNEQHIEIEKRSLILDVQQAEIDTKSKTITAKNDIIKKQKKTLLKSSEKIENQQNYLYILSILIIAAISGAVISYWLFRKNQAVNSRLLVALNKSNVYACRLEVANEQLKSFSYTVSHDLRSPLRSIMGFSQFLLEDHRDELDEQATEYLDRIISNVDKMDALITDILTLSKLSQIEIKYTENVNLSEIVLDEIENLKEVETRDNLKITIKDNVRCHCDPALIKMVLANLVGNAWKYTAKTKETKIEFGVKNIKDEPVYYIKDNGVGFDMQSASRLFEPFQRLHAVEQFEGSGVGLATVKRIINLHHGKVWAESVVDKGTTLFFSINSEQ